MDVPQLKVGEPFDLKAAHAQIGDAMVTMIKLMLPVPGSQPDQEAAQAAWQSLLQAITAGSHACNEVKRLRSEVAELRDAHRPRPHADPTAPGALCVACSLGGALVNWPCSPWQSADRIINQTGA
jgi:hypothetical protein